MLYSFHINTKIKRIIINTTIFINRVQYFTKLEFGIFILQLYTGTFGDNFCVRKSKSTICLNKFELLMLRQNTPIYYIVMLVTLAWTIILIEKLSQLLIFQSKFWIGWCWYILSFFLKFMYINYMVLWSNLQNIF